MKTFLLKAMLALALSLVISCSQNEYRPEGAPAAPKNPRQAKKVDKTQEAQQMPPEAADGQGR